MESGSARVTILFVGFSGSISTDFTTTAELSEVFVNFTETGFEESPAENSSVSVFSLITSTFVNLSDQVDFATEGADVSMEPVVVAVTIPVPEVAATSATSFTVSCSEYVGDSLFAASRATTEK